MKTPITILAALMIIFTSCRQEIATSTYKIIPEPQSISYANGSFEAKKKLSIAFPQALANEAVLLEKWIEEVTALSTTLTVDAQKGDIRLIIEESLMPEHAEGYELDIAKKGIAIKANSPAGILHGIQSLKQMFRQENGVWKVQAGKIIDYPAFSWRAFMLDEGRYFKGKKVVFDLLDEMSALKMNVFHWHLTEDLGWRIEIKKYPLLTEVGAFRDSTEINNFNSNVFDGEPHGGFYTQEEIKEVVNYASRLHIRVIPEIEMPGHASAAIAAYPWLGTSGKTIKVPSKLGVLYDVFNVTGPRVLRFFEDVIDEVITLFPDPIFHIGGDEVRYNQWKESLMVQKYMHDNNIDTPADLQVFFTNNISKLLASKGKRMMGWNEITGAQLHEYQSATDTKTNQSLAKGSIVHFWKGDTELIKQTTTKGYDVVNSHHQFTYLDYTYESISLEKAYNFDPVPEGLTTDQQKHILGLGCQMWGEFIPTVEKMNLKVYPHIAAYAETGWTKKEKKDFGRFQESLIPLLQHWEKKGIVYGGK